MVSGNPGYNLGWYSNVMIRRLNGVKPEMSRPTVPQYGGLERRAPALDMDCS
jgi:hypothetical protein